MNRQQAEHILDGYVRMRIDVLGAGMTDREKMYRRQLGGAEAALRRERQKAEKRIAELEDDNDHLQQKLLGFEDEVIRQDERIAALEELIRDMWFWGYEGHMDSESQDWQMKHIDGVLDRMRELVTEVEQ